MVPMIVDPAAFELATASAHALAQDLAAFSTTLPPLCREPAERLAARANALAGHLLSMLKAQRELEASYERTFAAMKRTADEAAPAMDALLAMSKPELERLMQQMVDEPQHGEDCPP